MCHFAYANVLSWICNEPQAKISTGPASSLEPGPGRRSAYLQSKGVKPTSCRPWDNRKDPHVAHLFPLPPCLSCKVKPNQARSCRDRKPALNDHNPRFHWGNLPVPQWWPENLFSKTRWHHQEPQTFPNGTFSMEKNLARHNGAGGQKHTVETRQQGKSNRWP